MNPQEEALHQRERADCGVIRGGITRPILDPQEDSVTPERADSGSTVNMRCKVRE